MTRHFDVRYRWTFDDYVALSKAQARLTWWGRAGPWILGLMILALFVCAAGAAWDKQWGFAVYFAFLGSALLAIRLVAGPRHRRYQFAHQRLGESGNHLTATDAGMVYRTDLVETRCKRGFLRRIDETPDYIFLWPNARMGWMVPKRVFASPQEATAFVEFLKEKTVGQTF